MAERNLTGNRKDREMQNGTELRLPMTSYDEEKNERQIDGNVER